LLNKDLQKRAGKATGKALANRVSKVAVEYLTAKVAAFTKAVKDLVDEYTPEFISSPGPGRDITIGVAVVVEFKTVEARIGDGGTAGGAEVFATGNVTLESRLESRPDISAVSKANNSYLDPNKEVSPGADPKVAAIGVGGGVIVGLYHHTATATIAGNAQVDAGRQLTVSARSLNQIDPSSLWGANL